MRCNPFYAFAFAFLSPFTAICQLPVKSFSINDLTDNYFNELRKQYGYKKEYPAELEKQALIALSYYPELKNTPIKFQHRPNHSPGFARVTWGGLFESPRKRHFLIVISEHTEELLMPLIFKNVSLDAQIGLIGHELAHVSSFLKMTSLGIIKHVFSSLSPKYLDKFEGNTDAICIDHGLGYQLLAWSTHVRMKMNTVNWDGPDRVHKSKKRNRYMNPDAILRRISMIPLYQASR